MGGEYRDQCISSLVIFLILVSFLEGNFVLANLTTLAPLYSPADSYLIDCGSAHRTTLQDGRTFKSDPETVTLLDSGEDVEFSVDSISVVQGNPNFPPSAFPLCPTVRIFSKESAYSFFISQGGKHWIRLYFFALPHPLYDLKNSEFSVLADETVLLRDFSMKNETNSPVFKEYLVDATDKLLIRFQPNKGSVAFVNAIEVSSAPDTLISNSAPLAVNPGISYKGLDSLSLEICYRLNVGGPVITPKNDTLSRTWIPDTAYNAFPQGSKNVTSARPIKYPYVGSTPVIAPNWVYASAQQMQDSRTMEPIFNLTWKMTADPSFNYLVRLHFCDIVSKSANDLYFNVYINSLVAINSLDLSSKVGLGTAYYTDFVLNSSYIPDGAIMVQVGPVPSGQSGKINAILNGLEIMKLSNQAKSLDGLIAADGTNKGSGLSSTILKILAGLGLIMAVTAVVFLGIVIIRWKTRPMDWDKGNRFSSWLLPIQLCQTSFLSSISKKSKSSSSHLSNQGLGKNFTLNEIKLATMNFDEKRVIGVGGFGKVYFGELDDGTKIAVKRGTSGSQQGITEFQTEIHMLSQLRHRHLVSLVGFCDEESEMILVYEFMANGPFRDHLYGNSNVPSLPWLQRLEICVGACRGLHYLHTGGAQAIIHRDVKTTNILLDENLVAKVSDFGLSKATAIGCHVSTAVKGSFGYLDPEYFKRQQLTDKSDVYSFGVVLFEVLCGRAVICPNLPREQVSLAEWALTKKRNGQLENIIDPRIASSICPEALKKYVQTAEKCLEDYGAHRPGMGDVLWNLEYALQLQQAYSQVNNNPDDKSINVIALEEYAWVGLSKRDPEYGCEVTEGSSNIDVPEGPSTGR
ncbi:hypothetical protein ACFE04_010458 [Oxalis oulophora]